MNTAPAEADPILYGKPLVFKEKSHRYFWDGKPIPSVTTILGRLQKQALIQWAANCAVDYIEEGIERATMCGEPMELLDFSPMFDGARRAHTMKRDAAGDVGTFLHDYARRRLAGESVAVADADDPTRKVIEAFEEWRAQHDIVPLGLERRSMSLKHWYAGTMDFWGTIDGRLCVLDFKTGKAIYDEFWLQTAGYEHALLEEHPHLDRMQRWIVRLDKRDGEFEAVPRPHSAANTECFLSLVEVDKYMRLSDAEVRAAAKGAKAA